MPIAAGTNCLTQAEDKLQSLLADVPAVQTWLGAIDAAAAKLRIVIDADSLPTSEAYEATGEGTEWTDLFPGMLIQHAEDTPIVFSRIAVGGGYHYQVNGFTDVSLHQVQTEPDIATAERAWKNTVGDILEGMRLLLSDWNSEYLYPTRFSLVDIGHVEQDREATQDKVQAALIRIEWGIDEI